MRSEEQGIEARVLSFELTFCLKDRAYKVTINVRDVACESKM